MKEGLPLPESARGVPVTDGRSVFGTIEATGSFTFHPNLDMVGPEHVAHLPVQSIRRIRQGLHENGIDMVAGDASLTVHVDGSPVDIDPRTYEKIPQIEIRNGVLIRRLPSIGSLEARNADPSAVAELKAWHGVFCMLSQMISHKPLT